jgi:hypothetical protein
MNRSNLKPILFSFGRTLRVLPCLLVLSLASTSTPAFAGDQASVVSIVPDVEDKSSELPPVPGRLSLFGWNGSPGTEYTVTFSVTQEPAAVVAVGARIQSTTFDPTESTLTVELTYDGAVILTDDTVPVPESSFLIAIDPGVDAKASARASKTLAAESTRPCYGPAADTSKAQDRSDDFGDEGGLLDPPVANDTDTTIGFPREAAGSYASTNSFFWCLIPPSSGGVDPGFKVLGPKGKTDTAELFLSDSFVGYLAATSGNTLSARSFGLFSEGTQVSIDVSDRDTGISADASLLFQEGVTSIGDDPLNTSAAGLAFGDIGDPIRKRAAPPTLPAVADLIERSFEFGKREALSLAPSDITPSGSSLDLFGFVGDEDLIGATIEIVRVQDLKCNEVQAAAVSGVVIARDTVRGNGSFNVKIPTSTAFPTNNSKAQLISRINGEQVQLSRQITLTNQSRNARR